MRPEIGDARIRAAYAKRTTRHARYSWFDSAHLFLIQERERHVLAALKRNHLSTLETARILEIGCGTGHWLREFIKWGARPECITGLDLLPDRVADARRLCPEAVRIECASAVELPFPAETFDLVLQSTVFSSILEPGAKRRVASEMVRVLKADGMILWYDFYVNNPWNVDVRGVNRSEIHELFPECGIAVRRITLAPPLARLLAPYSWFACDVLAQVPWLRTHYLGVIRRRR